MNRRINEILRTALKRHITDLQKVNPQLSIRSISKKLELSPTTISFFLNRRRNASQRTFDLLYQKLKFTNEESDFIDQYLKDPIDKNFDELPKVPSITWTHFLILSYLQTKNLNVEKKEQIKKISHLLNFPKNEIRKILNELEESKAIKMKNGSYKTILPEGNFEGNISVRNINKEIINFVSKKVEELDDPKIFLENNFSAITIPASSKKIDHLNDQIRTFQDSISRAADYGPKENDCVITLAVQLIKS